MLIAEKARDDSERQLVKETIEKVMKVQINIDLLYSYYPDPPSSSVYGCPRLSWTRSMRRLYILITKALEQNEPVLLVGETGSGKTSICQFIAATRKQSLVMLNAHQNLESSDLVGAQRPIRDREAMLEQQLQDLRIVVVDEHIELAEGSFQQLMEYYLSHKSDIQRRAEGNEEKITACKRINSCMQRQQRLFEWVDGPLVRAMKMEEMFLFDEISLADDAVLERLNSVLEEERTMVLAENFGDLNIVKAGTSFQFLATMNPGGDYGKKELSPALRNRFTEIWVPPLSEYSEISEIVNEALLPKLRNFSEVIVNFSSWFSARYSSRIQNLSMSVRDILSWVSFVNDAGSDINNNLKLAEGARMIFIDCLSFLPEVQSMQVDLHSEQLICQEKLSSYLDVFEKKLLDPEISIALTGTHLKAGIFQIARTNSFTPVGFVLDTPTTKKNLFKIVRALTLPKPLLLEGSPGIGKTATVEALARLVGQNLIRINLSDQTDVSDLFGSDLPVTDGSVGMFAWRSAPFLHALEKGHWVLLDELNLASQSVLESLNACFDHRGTAYIPELGRSFNLHPNFRVFAAQNPLSQGGGRKGLPKSFLNRFNLIYMEPLDAQDMLEIAMHSFPTITSTTSHVERLIAYLFELQSVYGPSAQRGRSAGGPWEFNLRDLFRWLQILQERDVLSELYGSEAYLGTLILNRLRSSEEVNFAKSLYQQFIDLTHPPKFFSLQPTHFLAGISSTSRNCSFQLRDVRSAGQAVNHSALESLNVAIKMGWPTLLVGSSFTGKTNALDYLSSINDAALCTFFVNPETDAMDLIGNFQQQDHLNIMVQALKHCIHVLQVKSAELLVEKNNFGFNNISKLLQLFESVKIDHSDRNLLLNELCGLHDTWSANVVSIEKFCSPTVFHTISDSIKDSIAKQHSAASFIWVDGPLVEAAKLGQWIVLENANLCSPSVLDRLNALLESGDSLLIHENPQTDGSPAIIQIHREFRIFITMDPAFGELSRPMRNRCVEVFFDKDLSFVHGELVFCPRAF